MQNTEIKNKEYRTQNTETNNTEHRTIQNTEHRIQNILNKEYIIQNAEHRNTEFSNRSIEYRTKNKEIRNT